jgi:hypothetical protein
VVLLVIGVVLGVALASSANAQVIHSFDTVGTVANAGLVVGRDGWLYGTRAQDGDYGGGTVFRVQVTGAGFEVLHHLGDPATSDVGFNPSGPLVEGVTGVFYGTTREGGTDGWGGIFQVDTTVTPPVVTAVRSFSADQGVPHDGVTLASDGMLYGTAGSAYATPDVVYRIATDGTQYEQLYRFPGSDTDPTDPGRSPRGVIEGSDGFLYGTTFNGPDLLRGKVFKMAKDGTQFQVLAEAPGQIIAPPLEIESGGDRWIYVLAADGPGVFPAGAPNGSIFRVLADGSSSERLHTFDPTILDLGAPPTGRLVRIPRQAGVYGLTSYAGGACLSGEGCGSVYRAVGPNPYPLHVFQNSGGDGISPQGAIAQAPDGRLFVLTNGGGPHGMGTIYAVNDAATLPLQLSGPASVQTTLQAYGNAAYSFSVANRNGSTHPLTSLQVYVETSSALQFTGQTSGSGWSCVQPDPAFTQYTCSWAGSLSPGDEAAATMNFLVSPHGSFAPACGAAPTPCVTFRADLVSAGTVVASTTATTAVTVIHPNTGLPNTVPVANDDSMTVMGADAVNIRVLDNDSSSPAENDFLSIEIITQPSQGYASPGGNLTIDYTPYAPLTGPDTFQYRLTDTFGASDIATVTLNPPQGFTLSKTLIDVGQLRAGEMATARLSIYGPGTAAGTTVLEALSSTEITQIISANGLPYDPAAAVSAPDDFRGSPWNTLNPASINYRAHASVGRVSIIRARFVEAGGTDAGTVVVVGVSADPVSGQVRAVDDQGQFAVDTPVTIDVLQNDMSATLQPLAAGMGYQCTNPIEVLFDSAACVPTAGAFSLGYAPTFNPLTFTPAPGFSGTTAFAYASGDIDTCNGTPGCRWESTLYWARATMTGGGATPPNLVASKAILDQGALVATIEAVNGDTVVFRIGAVNQPPAGGTPVGLTTAPVTVTDTLPNGLAFLPAQSDSRCSASGQVVTCTSAVVLNQGGEVWFDIAATVVANPLPGESVALYNEAVAATAAEITTADNLSPYVQVMVSGAVQADLGLTIVPGAASVPAGLPISVAATITNSGPNAASTVVFSGLGTLTGFDQVSITPAANCPVPAPGAPVVCTFAFLAASASQTVVFTGTPHTADPSVLAAGSVTAAEPDPNAANNGATASLVVAPPIVPPDLHATKFIVDETGALRSTITVNEAAQVRFRIQAVNAANAGDTTGPVTMTDTLPAELTAVQSAGPGCEVIGQVVRCVSTDPLAPGGSVSFDIIATARPGVAGSGNSITVQNQATVSTSGDTTPADNVSPAVSVTILGPPNTPVSTMPVTVPLMTGAGAPVPVTVTFSAVTSEGQTVANPISPPPPVPSGFQIASQAYDITTTAAFAPPVTVCLDGSFTNADVLLHGEGGSWVELPNQQRLPVGGPPYTRVCAETASFSPFVVATRVNRAPTVTAGPDQTIEPTSAAGAVAAVAGAASDLDDDTLTYTWSGACGAASGASASLSCPLGTNLVTLSVSDGQNPAVTDTLTITVRDTTAPHLICGAADGVWHATDQTVACTASDAVGVSPADASFALATSVAAGVETSTAMTNTRQVCDAAGNCATAGPVGPFRIDRRGPAISLTAPASNASYTVGQAVTAAFTCTDGGSGVQSCQGTLANGASVPTGTAGTYTFAVDAVDQVGNTASSSVTYTVTARTFAFEGFFWPVQNPPVVNRVKAGSAIPVRFGLGGNRGLNIFAVGSPQVVQVACDTGQPTGEVGETVTAGQSGLLYNPLTKRYIYIWKTQKSMAGACWRLTMQFTDGTSAFALFEMRK